ncbi:MAG: ATP-dependent Clp protease adaptor ClpS [Lachnospiraceae bacterium]|nr:ATP-dependent Clp protease adaptor ClpS [Lachnospiraceae bacterium]
MATKSGIKERTNDKLMEPKHYKVIMHNDDFTTMEFVVEVLVSIFHKDQVTAETLMLDVHKKGMAVVGVYPYDIAYSKVNKAIDMARAEGFPFRMTVEAE